MIKVDRNAPGQVMLRNLCKLSGIVAAAWLSIIGAYFVIWLMFWAVS